MFDLIRVAFLTVVNAYRPVFGRPQRLSELPVRPILIALFFIIVVVPFAQQFLLSGLVWQPEEPTSVALRIVHRLSIFMVEMLAVVPWLWLASTLMMRWPCTRYPITRPKVQPATDLQGLAWKSMTLMFGVLFIIALLLEVNVQVMEYLDETSDTYEFESNGSPGGLIGFISLILLARYGLVLHGLAIGRPMSFRQSAQRLAGRSYRLFWSLLVVASAAAYSPITPDQSWFSSVPPLLRFGTDVRVTSTMLDMGVIVSAFVFGFAVCAIAEVIARAYSATEAVPTETQESPVPARA